ncbi:MAG: efflux RND transporter periplasmic adaptor subunit [Myxococcales bacterium]|nr:efflux RND transporter periplasmic adaptor subunit [Myxococcales bacterium]
MSEHEPTSALENKPTKSSRTVAAVVAALSIAGLLVAAKQRIDARSTRDARAQPETGAPRVLVARPRPAEASIALSLPGTARPQQSTPLYARASGYARTLRADLGDVVRRGQVLAIIDAPELADQLRSASARLREATDNVAIVRTQLARTQRLVAGRFSAAAEEDDVRLRLSAAESARRTSRAEFERLSTLSSYLQVLAPFDGTITRRHVQQGALVTAGTTLLYDIATTSELRVDVDVPQWASSAVRVGVVADVAPREGGGEPVRATVTRTAGALDPVARTLRAELQLPRGAPVLSGAYVYVRFTVARRNTAVVIPSGAITAGADGTVVYTVSEDGVARRVRVELGRDLGRDVEVLEGLRASDRILVFPPASLADGERVVTVERAPEPRGRS